jgi:GxxExxY protein
MESGDKYSAETNEIIGLAIQAHKELGHGFREKTYENALLVLLKQHNIPFETQKRYPIIFHGEKIDEFIPDLIIYGKIIVDLKTIPQISDLEIGQMLNYPKVTNLELALILNFKNPRLEIKRVAR